MIVTVTGKHIEITDAIRAHIEDKASKLPRYFNSVMQIEVIVEGTEGVMQNVEVIVSVEHREDVVARESGPDLYACIDMAMHKMERQLRKIKEKQRDNKYGTTAERERHAERSPIQEEDVA
jgi:putative sigma-54 modulation protein